MLRFSDGLALIRQNDLFGYINVDYDIAIAPSMSLPATSVKGWPMVRKTAGNT